MLIELFVEYAPLKHDVQIWTRFIKEQFCICSRALPLIRYFYTIGEQNVERRFQIAIKSGINRAIFHAGAEVGGARSRKWHAWFRYHERYRAIKLMRKEEQRVERERDATRKGLSPNGSRNVAPRWPTPFMEAHSPRPFSFGPPQFPPFSLIAQGTLLNLPCVIGVQPQPDL